MASTAKIIASALPDAFQVVKSVAHTTVDGKKQQKTQLGVAFVPSEADLAVFGAAAHAAAANGKGRLQGKAELNAAKGFPLACALAQRDGQMVPSKGADTEPRPDHNYVMREAAAGRMVHERDAWNIAEAVVKEERSSGLKEETRRLSRLLNLVVKAKTGKRRARKRFEAASKGLTAFSKLKSTQRSERIVTCKMIGKQLKALGGGDLADSKERDALIAELIIRSIFPSKGDTIDFVGKDILRFLLKDERMKKLLAQVSENMSYINPLFAQLRIVASGTSEKSCLALAPFLKDGMPSAPTRRKYMNRAVNEVINTIVAVGESIASADTDDGAREAAAGVAEAAQVEEAMEEDLPDELWYYGADNTTTSPEERDELETALGATGAGGKESVSHGIRHVDDAPALMLPLLLKDSCVRSNHVSERVLFRLSCDGLVTQFLGYIKGDQHLTAATIQPMGNGARGAEMVRATVRTHALSADGGADATLKHAAHDHPRVFGRCCRSTTSSRAR